MKSKLLRKSSPFIPVLLVLVICSCNQKSDQFNVKCGGKEYSYRKLEHKIKDLEAEPLNTRWIETEHCLIQYSTEFEEYLENMVTISEEAYTKVAKDLKFNINKKKPRIFYLNKEEYERFTRPIKSIGLYNEGIIVINTYYGKLGNEDVEKTTSRLVIHEMTHFVLDQIIMGSLRKTPGKIRAHNSLGQFCEGIVQYESRGPRRDELGEVLHKLFPEGNFTSFQEMDSGSLDTSYTSYRKASAEFEVLIKFLVDECKENTLLRILYSLDKLTVREAIERYTGIPFAQFEKEWFRYMKELFDNHKMNIPGGDYGKDSAKS